MFDQLAPRIMRDLLDEPHFDFELHDAAAVVGNLAYETGGFRHMQELKPVVKGSRGGYGWAQWTGPRRRAFEQWAKRKGLHIDSYEANYSFLIRELLTTEKKAVEAVKTARTLRQKTEAFEMAYERAGVKAYAKRSDWAKRSLEAYRASGRQTVARPALPSGPQPEVRASPRPASIDPAAPPQPSWAARMLAWIGVIRPTPVASVHAPRMGAPVLTVRRVQEQLQGLGYPEVGLADGLMGPKTQAAIRAFAADQRPALPSNGEITDGILAALARAQPRAVAENRAAVTAQDLRAAGNDQAKAFTGLGRLGQALGIGGLLGAVNEFGAFDAIRDTASDAAARLSTIQSALVTIVSAVQWTIAHWWLFAILAGLWTIYRVTVAVLNLVVLFRQGILQRPSVAPDGGRHGIR